MIATIQILFVHRGGVIAGLRAVQLPQPPVRLFLADRSSPVSLFLADRSKQTAQALRIVHR
jgi:hypothetical protein